MFDCNEIPVMNMNRKMNEGKKNSMIMSNISDLSDNSSNSSRNE